MRFWQVLLIGFLVAGCSAIRSPVGLPPGSGLPRPDEISVPAQTDDGLFAFPSPSGLTLDELTEGLRKLANRGDGPVGARVARLFDHWRLKHRPDTVPFLEADLDEDGKNEIILALNGAGLSQASSGAVFVLSRDEGARWRVHRTSDHDDHAAGVALHAVTDLTGDGRPEIVWSTTTVGAHTAHTSPHISNWKAGRFTHLPFPVTMATAQVGVDGRDLLLKGGLITSAGAGLAQRERTDRYRWNGEAFRLMDRRYAPSEWSYHRLLDGIQADELGRTDEAKQHYLAALEPGRTALPPDVLDPSHRPGPEALAAFRDAVRALARVRLVALHLQKGDQAAADKVIDQADGRFAPLLEALASAPTREAACRAASNWAAARPAMVAALNSPYGYATPQFQVDGLCGPVPNANK